MPALLAVLLAAGPAQLGSRPKMAVLELAAAGEVDAAVARSLTESIAAELDARGFFEPVSSTEIATMLGLERQKQLLGCADESCLAELAGALGAPYVLSGSLTRLGGIFQLNLQVIDTAKGRPLGRSTKVAKDFESLRALLPWAVAEACGTPLPKAPSKVPAFAVLGLGAAAVVAGGVLGVLALNNESVLKGELLGDDKNPVSRPVVLNTAESYQARLRTIALQKTVSLAALLAGAVGLGLGLWLLPPDAPQTGVRVALVPGPAGLALVGLFP